MFPCLSINKLEIVEMVTWSLVKAQDEEEQAHVVPFPVICSTQLCRNHHKYFNSEIRKHLLDFIYWHMSTLASLILIHVFQLF